MERLFPQKIDTIIFLIIWKDNSMAIYTKKGDNDYTSLASGTRVKKRTMSASKFSVQSMNLILL